MFWIDRTEMNSRADLQRFADRNIFPILVAYLDIENLHLRPIFPHLRFPLAQLRRCAATVARKIFIRSRGGNVETLGVFFHHPLRVEHRRDAANRFAHQLQPGEGKFAVRLRVIERDDLVLEQLIKTARVHFVLKFDCAIVDFGADRPAVVAVVTFAPPAVEHAQIDPAIGRRFHSACPACFQWPKRMVQPKIDPLDKTARDVAIVVFQENDAILDSGFAAKFVNLLNERLAGFVARMRFACENELHGSRRVIEQSFQPFLVAEQERGPFVSRETARETDSQNFRVKNPICPANGFRRFPQALATPSLPFADKLDETQFEFLMRLPKLRIRNIDNAAPEIGLG